LAEYDGSNRSFSLFCCWSFVNADDRLPPRPRLRFGVADREPGGVGVVFPGVVDPELPLLVFRLEFVTALVAAFPVPAVPNSSCRRSSYLRCFSSRSLAACALRSSAVNVFLEASSSSDEDAS
jgi:hypothetical protein